MGSDVQKSEAVKRLILVMVALMVVAVAAFAWFTYNRVTTVEPVQVHAADGTSVAVKLFHYNPSTKEYEEIPRLVCENMLAGQTEKYYFEIENKDNKPYRISLDFVNWQGKETQGGTPEQNFALCKVLTFQGMRAEPILVEGESMVADNTLDQMMREDQPDDPLNTSFRFANITLGGGAVRKLYFEVTLPGEQAGKSHQKLAVFPERINIAVTEKLQ